MGGNPSVPGRRRARSRVYCGGDRSVPTQPCRAVRRLPRVGHRTRLEREGGAMSPVERLEFMRQRLMRLYLRWLEEGEPVR